MSRTNPYKKKRRSASKTLLIFGEGMGEEMLLKHLRKLYSFNSNVAITIKKGKGGNARNIVADANRIIGDYDKRIVILDNDKPEEEMEEARKEAKKRKIELIENVPCLEFLLISIVDKKPTGKSSNWCKHKFETEYIDRKKRGETDEYDKLFPQKLLNNKRFAISELKKLISIMEGK